MPRKKSTPERTNRLTALLSDQEMKRAKRLIKKLDGVSNLSELVRVTLDEKAKVAFARAPKSASKEPTEKPSLVGSETVASAKPGRKRGAGKSTARGAKRGRPRKTATEPSILVADQTPKTPRRRTKRSAATNGVAQVA